MCIRDRGYLEEEHANRDSDAETFVALRVDIRNWRWSGVPFYLRTGKRMPQKLSQIVIHFKEPPQDVYKRQPSTCASSCRACARCSSAR